MMFSPWVARGWAHLRRRSVRERTFGPPAGADNAGHGSERDPERNPALQRAVNGYLHSLMQQITQTAACNRFHIVEARLARWLLMTRDRMRSSKFRMTHDFLSHMLGVRRVGITEAASSLQRKKLIEYTRGNIQILDNRGLEAASCGCYEVPV